MNLACSAVLNACDERGAEEDGPCTRVRLGFQDGSSASLNLINGQIEPPSNSAVSGLVRISAGKRRFAIARLVTMPDLV